MGGRGAGVFSLIILYLTVWWQGLFFNAKGAKEVAKGAKVKFQSLVVVIYRLLLKISLIYLNLSY
jgi:hypothetical protein